MPPINAPLSMGTPKMDFNDPAGSYNSAYQNYISTNQQLYNNYVSNSNSLVGRYGALKGEVQGMLRGGNKANLQDIADKYQGFWGQMSQQLIDRGLGNTTVQQSMSRGVKSDATQEMTRSRNMYSGLKAQFASVLGQAQLGAQGHALDSIMQYVSAPPPDAGMFAQLAAMKSQQSNVGLGNFGMPGASAPYAPTGGYLPKGFAGTGGGTIDYGGGGYASLGETYGSGPSWNTPQAYGVQSAAGVGQQGQYYPSYATSAQDAWSPAAGGNYAQVEASYGQGGKSDAYGYGGAY